MSQSLNLVVKNVKKTELSALEVTLVAMVLLFLLGGCSSVGEKLSDAGAPKLSLPKNTAGFKRDFYAGANLGSSMLDPDTGSMNTAYTGSQSATGSQIRFGYDLHNLLSLEVDSSILGTATVNQAGTAEVNYSSFSASAIMYGFNSAANRSRRTGWSGFGRLGVALNKRASNVAALDGNDTDLVYGLGVEYGFANRLAVRLEGASYGSDSAFAGLGLIYRFDGWKRLLPGRMVRVRGRDSALLLGAALPKVLDPDAKTAENGSAHSGGGSVRLLASALDHDADGILNDADKCAGTAARTTVNKSGCGIFDGPLAGVEFENGSSGLSDKARESLDNFVVKLLAFPEVRVAIEGHTDNKGPADINSKVAQSRADSVRRYLLKSGIPAMQLETRTAGETEAIADNSSEGGQQKNRRVDVVTLPNLSLEEYRESFEPTKQEEVAELSTGAGSNKKASNTSSLKIAEDEPMLAAGKPGIDLLPGVVSVPGLNIGGVLRDVGFENGSATLTKASVKGLQVIADELKRFPETRIAIVAHTNTEKSAQGNLALTLRQAKAVTRQLSRLGVNRRRMKALGFGDTLPLMQNLSERHQKVNRRIELRLVED